MNVILRPVLRVVSVLVTLLAVGGTALASSSAYPPACPAGAQPGVNPPLACLHRSYVSDSYTARFVGGRVSVRERTVRHGHYSYVAVKVSVPFATALRECPGGGVPLQDIPCQLDSVAIGISGRYRHGHPRLDTSSDPTGNPVGCTPQSTSGVCTFDFRLYEDVSAGSWVWVFGVSDEQLTKKSVGALGAAGFEFSVGVRVPRPPRS